MPSAKHDTPFPFAAFALLTGSVNRLGELLEVMDDLDAQIESGVFQFGSSDKCVVVAVVAAVAALFGACWLVAPLFGACWLVAPLFGASLIGLPFRPWYPRAPRYMRVGEPRYEDAIVCENVTIRTPDNLPLIRALSFAVQRGESMLVMGTFQRVFCFF